MRVVSYLTLFTAFAAGIGYAQSPSDIDCIGNGFTKTIGSSATAPPGNTEIRIKTDAFYRRVGIRRYVIHQSRWSRQIPFEYINRDSNSYGMQNYFVDFTVPMVPLGRTPPPMGVTTKLVRPFWVYGLIPPDSIRSPTSEGCTSSACMALTALDAIHCDLSVFPTTLVSSAVDHSIQASTSTPLSVQSWQILASIFA